MNTVVVSRPRIIVAAILLPFLFGLGVTAGWVLGYNKATGQLAAERLGIAIKIWESLNEPSSENTRELLEMEITSAATELFASSRQVTTKHLGAYRDRLRVIAEKCRDAEFQQTLLTLVGMDR